MRNPFYWIAAFSFIFTYLAGTAVYSVVVSSINAEVTRSVDKSLFVCSFFIYFLGSCIEFLARSSILPYLGQYERAQP